MQSNSSTAPPRHYDNTWCDLDDDALRRYHRQYRRRLALIDGEVPEDVRESTREYLTMCVADAEHEEARRARAAELGVPREGDTFPQEWIADLKARIRLDDLLIHDLGARLGKPTPKGIRRGPCPICKTSERSDSFLVSTGDPHDQHYYCFRCGARGDAINATMQAWGYSFPQAVTHLAQQGNVPLPTRPRPAPTPTNPSYLHLMLGGDDGGC